MIVNRFSKQIILSLLAGCLFMSYSGGSFDVLSANAQQLRMLTDFTQASPDLQWYVQNDTVMGGRSNGQFKQSGGVLVFSGETNTNGGGFSSIRTRALQLNLSSHDGIRLAVKGDGRRYTWHLQTDATWRGRKVSYWSDFDTQSGKWVTVDIGFSKFKPQFRGFQLDGPELDRAKITQMGLYIYDKRDGPFEFQLDSVQAYSSD